MVVEVTSTLVSTARNVIITSKFVNNMNIDLEIKNAMLARDSKRLVAVKAIKNAFTIAKTEKGSTGELSEEQELKIIQKLCAQRKESFDIFSKENRLDLATREKEELDILETFLPVQLPDHALKTIIEDSITNLQATSIKDMGKVIGAVSKRVAGQAEGSRISKMVKELLSQ